ncbi:hypothetical protein OAM34_01450 [Alphaproteobacteria bacterium]|nr:hypothetical protein [Alphaproteobacteria bacterium]MDC0461653.1 hypothetical protein [Alphaproteobacteria bacterium]
MKIIHNYFGDSKNSESNDVSGDFSGSSVLAKAELTHQTKPEALLLPDS